MMLMEYIDGIQLYKQDIYCKNTINTISEILCRISDILDIGKFVGDLNENQKFVFDLKILEKIHSEVLVGKNKSITYNVNISPTTLASDEFLFSVYHMLDMFQNLNIEITEDGRNLTHKEIEIVNKNINFLINYGTKFGIDDYPEGNTITLLNTIKQISFVKIDKSIFKSFKVGEENVFIKDLTNLIYTLDKMSPGIDLYLEGIETKEQEEIILKHFGNRIKFFQGFLYSKPHKI